jgi:hypothetical protein
VFRVKTIHFHSITSIIHLTVLQQHQHIPTRARNPKGMGVEDWCVNIRKEWCVAWLPSLISGEPKYFSKIPYGDTLQGKRAVGSAQLIVPAMFHGSTSCCTGGLTTYEFFTQPNCVISHNGNPALRLHNTYRRAHSSTTSVLPNTVNPIVQKEHSY